MRDDSSDHRADVHVAYARGRHEVDDHRGKTNDDRAAMRGETSDGGGRHSHRLKAFHRLADGLLGGLLCLLGRLLSRLLRSLRCLLDLRCRLLCLLLCLLCGLLSLLRSLLGLL